MDETILTLRLAKAIGDALDFGGDIRTVSEHSDGEFTFLGSKTVDYTPEKSESEAEAESESEAESEDSEYSDLDDPDDPAEDPEYFSKFKELFVLYTTDLRGRQIMTGNYEISAEDMYTEDFDGYMIDYTAIVRLRFDLEMDPETKIMEAGDYEDLSARFVDEVRDFKIYHPGPSPLNESMFEEIVSVTKIDENECIGYWIEETLTALDMFLRTTDSRYYSESFSDDYEVSDAAKRVYREYRAFKVEIQEPDNLRLMSQLKVLEDLQNCFRINYNGSVVWHDTKKAVDYIVSKMSDVLDNKEMSLLEQAREVQEFLRSDAFASFPVRFEIRFLTGNDTIYLRDATDEGLIYSLMSDTTSGLQIKHDIIVNPEVQDVYVKRYRQERNVLRLQAFSL